MEKEKRERSLSIIRLKDGDDAVIKRIAKATKMDAWVDVDEERYLVDTENGKRLKTRNAVITMYEGLEYTDAISAKDYHRFMQILYQLVNRIYC